MLFLKSSCNTDYCRFVDEIKEFQAENERLKEKIIKLTEENGNLIINRNTAKNKLQDTESRLISIQKANTHNLVLLQRRNNALEEIREISNFKCKACDKKCNSCEKFVEIEAKISEVENE